MNFLLQQLHILEEFYKTEYEHWCSQLIMHTCVLAKRIQNKVKIEIDLKLFKSDLNKHSETFFYFTIYTSNFYNFSFITNLKLVFVYYFQL